MFKLKWQHLETKVFSNLNKNVMFKRILRFLQVPPPFHVPPLLQLQWIKVKRSDLRSGKIHAWFLDRRNRKVEILVTIDSTSHSISLDWKGDNDLESGKDSNLEIVRFLAKEIFTFPKSAFNTNRITFWLNMEKSEFVNKAVSLLRRLNCEPRFCDPEEGVVEASVGYWNQSTEKGAHLIVHVSLPQRWRAEITWPDLPTGSDVLAARKRIDEIRDAFIAAATKPEWLQGPSIFLPGVGEEQVFSCIRQFLRSRPHFEDNHWEICELDDNNKTIEAKLELRDTCIPVQIETRLAPYGVKVVLNWLPLHEHSPAAHISQDFATQCMNTLSSQLSAAGKFSEDDKPALAPAKAPWPSPQDFSEATQNPVNFKDKELQVGQVETNSLGLPQVRSGAFASVYRIHIQSRSMAVRCFLTALTDQQYRYNQLSSFIENDSLTYTVGFCYQPEGIRVNSRWYPILKMDWIDGPTLDVHVAQHVNNRAEMEQLAANFSRMMRDLRSAGIAHGDLQHGNILVKQRELVLVDYDCMFVPALKGLSSNELGHANYQHPARAAAHFGNYLDNFAALVIYTSLRSLSIDSSLLGRLDGGDECLLFRRSDFSEADTSRVFNTLLRHSSAEIRRLAEHLKAALQLKVEDIPFLDDYEQI